MTSRHIYAIGQTVRYWPTWQDGEEDPGLAVGTVIGYRTRDGGRHLDFEISAAGQREWVSLADVEELVEMPDLSTPDKIVEFLNH